MEATPPRAPDGEAKPPGSVQSWPLRAFERFLMALNSVGTIWIFALMFLICADVVLRSGFNRPIDGVTDIAAFSIIGIVFLQIAATVHTGRMTKAGVLLDIITRRSKRSGAIVEALFLLVGAAMFALLVRASWPLLTRSINRKEFFGIEGVFSFPTWPVRLIIIVGAAAVTVVYLIQAAQVLRDGFGLRSTTAGVPR